MKYPEPHWHNATQNDKKQVTLVRELLVYGTLILILIAFITFRFVVPMINKGLFTIN